MRGIIEIPKLQPKRPQRKRIDVILLVKTEGVRYHDIILTLLKRCPL